MGEGDATRPPPARWIGAALAVALVAILVPPLAVPLPPLVDYPNHLARLWLIAGHAARPPLDAAYVIDWSQAATNIGIDLLALGFGESLGVEAVGRAGIVLALLLPVLGTLALGRMVAGRWHAAMLLAPACAWNLPFAAGFLNHQISVGLAFLGAAAGMALGRKPLLRALFLAAAGLLIAIVHLFGILLLMALLAALAFGAEAPARGGWSAAARRAGLAVAPAAAALAIFFLFAPTLPGDAAGSAVPRWFWTWRPEMKAGALIAPFLTYHVAAGQVFALLLLVLGHGAVRRGWIGFHAGLCALAVALVLGGLLLPSSIGDTEQIEFRLSCAALLVAIAALRPREAMPPRVAAWAAAGLLAVTLLLSGAILRDWQDAQRDIAAVDRSLAALPRGAALLPIEGSEEDADGPARGPRLAGSWPLHTHYGLRAVMLRDALVPGLFAQAGKQPLRLRDPAGPLAAGSGGLPRPAQLAAAERSPTEDPRLRRWRQDFGFLLVLDAAAMKAGALPDGLELVADEGFARLYRVARR